MQVLSRCADPFLNDETFVTCVATLEELGATGNKVPFPSLCRRPLACPQTMSCILCQYQSCFLSSLCSCEICMLIYGSTQCNGIFTLDTGLLHQSLLGRKACKATSPFHVTVSQLAGFDWLHGKPSAGQWPGWLGHQCHSPSDCRGEVHCCAML